MTAATLDLDAIRARAKRRSSAVQRDVLLLLAEVERLRAQLVEDKLFDGAVDWLLNQGNVDYDMSHRFRALSLGLVTDDEVETLDYDEICARLDVYNGVSKEDS